MSNIYEVRATWTDQENNEVEEWVEVYCASQKIAEAYIASKARAQENVPDEFKPSYDEPVLTIHKVDSILNIAPEHLAIYYVFRDEEELVFGEVNHSIINLNDENTSNLSLPTYISEVLIKAGNKPGSLRVTSLEDAHGVEKTLFASSNAKLLKSIIDSEGN